MQTGKIKELIDKIVETNIFGENNINLEFSNDELSFFSSPVRKEYLKLDHIPFENKEALELFLFQIWNTNESMPLIKEIVEMAYELKLTNEEQLTDLSPYIYTLF